jgi:hypothetical protein
MRRTSSTHPDKEQENHDAALTDDLNEGTWKNKDPEEIAKEITDPLIQSMREELRKVDLSQFKK